MRTLYRDAALADGTGPELRVGVSILVIGDRIEWLGDVGDEPQLAEDTAVIDASGSTVIAGMVCAANIAKLCGAEATWCAGWCTRCRIRRG